MFSTLNLVGWFSTLITKKENDSEWISNQNQYGNFQTCALQQNWEQIKRNLLIAVFKAGISLTFQSYIDVELNYKMDTFSKKIID